MTRRVVVCTCLLIFVALCGGCCAEPVGPSLQQAKSWAAEEIRPGSTAAEVMGFAIRHGFELWVAPFGPHSQLGRMKESCDSRYSRFIEIAVDLNPEGRVVSASVQETESVYAPGRSDKQRLEAAERFSQLRKEMAGMNPAPKTRPVTEPSHEP